MKKHVFSKVLTLLVCTAFINCSETNTKTSEEKKVEKIEEKKVVEKVRDYAGCSLPKQGDRFTIDSLSPETAKELALDEFVQKKMRLEIGENADTATVKLIFDNLTWIKKIDIKATSIDNLNGIDKLTQLEFIQLSSITKEVDITDVSKLQNLKEIYLYATHVKDTDPLKTCKNLEIVRLYMARANSLEFLRGTPNVKILNLYGEHTFKNYEPVASLQKLEELNLYMNSQATDKNLSVLKQLTSLKELKIDFCKEFTNFDFLENCKDVEMISAWNAANLSDISALKGKNELIKLNILDTKVSSLEPLYSCEKLEKLSVAKSIGEKEIDAFKAKKPDVELKLEF